MNIRGRRSVGAPREAVFAAICDPSVLLAVIPGCREIHRTSETEYRGRITLRLPGVVGSYETIVQLVAAEAPSWGRLEGEVVGTLGTIRGHATFRLTEDAAGTTVDYEGEAAIGGPLARLDGRFIEGLAGSMIGQGLDTLDKRLRHETASGAATDKRPAPQETRA